MRVAYLTNQYPKVSHTFIRREILALEQAGITVDRYSIRPSGQEVVDPADIAERERTRAILAVGAVGLAMAFLKTALTRPLRMEN